MLRSCQKSALNRNDNGRNALLRPFLLRRKYPFRFLSPSARHKGPSGQ